MNTRLRVLFMMVFLLAGLASSAQFIGGDGRGGFMPASGPVPLERND